MSQYDELIAQLPPEAQMVSVDFGVGKHAVTGEWLVFMDTHFLCARGDGWIHVEFNPSPSKVDAELRAINLGESWAKFEAAAGRSNHVEYASVPLNDGTN